MTENFLTELAIGEETGGPAGLLAGPFQVFSTNALVKTQTVTEMTRKDPWRSSAVSKPILTAAGFSWACDVGDSVASDIILDAMGDPTRGTLAGNTRTWRVGRASDVRRFAVHTAPVEGGYILVSNAALRSAQLIIERGRIASWVTDWAAWAISDTDPTWTPEALANTTYATAATSVVQIDGEGLRIFSAAIQIDRGIQPANFTEASEAQAWTGGLAFDVVGRVALRLEEGDFLAAMTGQVLTREIVIEMTAGDRVRTITLPKCACEIHERRLVGPGTYEHLMDFAVLREEGEDVMTITSTTIP